MKLKNILKLAQLAVLSGVLLTACNLNEDNSKSNAAYMDEAANNKPIISLTLDVDGGMAYVFPRLANLGTCQTSLVVGVDEEALKKFNEQNNSKYAAVDANDFEIILPDGSAHKGDVTVSIEKESVGNPIGIKVGKLDDAKYPPAQKIAIPLSIKSASNVDALESAKSVILTINRPLITSVSKMRGGGFTVTFAEDLQEKTMDGWTFQFTANYYSLTRDNLNVGYFNNQVGGFYTRIYQNKGIQVKNGRDGDDTWTQKPLSANKWYQITFVYKDQTVSVYINGELQKTFGTTKIYHQEGSGFSIGNDKYNDYIREVRFWSKPLNQTEILENLYLPLDPETEGLESYLPLTKEVGVKDITSKGNEVSLHEGTQVSWLENVKFPSEELVIVE